MDKQYYWRFFSRFSSEVFLTEYASTLIRFGRSMLMPYGVICQCQKMWPAVWLPVRGSKRERGKRNERRGAQQSQAVVPHLPPGGYQRNGVREHHCPPCNWSSQRHLSFCHRKKTKENSYGSSDAQKPGRWTIDIVKDVIHITAHQNWITFFVRNNMYGEDEP